MFKRIDKAFSDLLKGFDKAQALKPHFHKVWNRLGCDLFGHAHEVFGGASYKPCTYCGIPLYSAEHINQKVSEMLDDVFRSFRRNA